MTGKKFAVLDGTVDMHYRLQGVEHVVTLQVGDVFFAEEGCEHVAHPRGKARILVVEREGSACSVPVSGRSRPSATGS
jgi:mannose-6-phosphate isomerase-like protein (cupin superfamily)